jgi:hypothetical protein
MRKYMPRLMRNLQNQSPAKFTFKVQLIRILLLWILLVVGGASFFHLHALSFEALVLKAPDGRLPPQSGLLLAAHCH